MGLKKKINLKFLSPKNVIFIKVPLFPKSWINILSLCTWRKTNMQMSHLTCTGSRRHDGVKKRANWFWENQSPISIILAIWLVCYLNKLLVFLSENIYLKRSRQAFNHEAGANFSCSYYYIFIYCINVKQNILWVIK